MSLITRLTTTKERAVSGGRELAEAVGVWGTFLTLPIERVLVVDVAGFTIRPAYPFMALLIFVNARCIRQAGVTAAVGSGILLSVVISAVTTGNARLSAGYTLWATFVVLFFLSSVGRLRGRRDLVYVWARAYVATAGLWGIFTIGQWIFSFWFPTLEYSSFGSFPRVHALALEPAFLAFYLVPPLILSFGTAQYHWTAAMLAAVVVSTSRSGLLGLAVGLVVLIVLVRGREAWRIAVAAGAATLSVAVLLLASHGSYLGFSSSTGFEKPSSVLKDPASVAPRLHSWSDAWKVFVDNPIDGVGPGAFGAALHDRGVALGISEGDLKTTNLWFEILAEEGVLGAIALLAWVVVGLAALWRRLRVEALAPAVFAAAVASLAMFAFVQTWWVPCRWIVWILAYSIGFGYSVHVGRHPGQAAEVRSTDGAPEPALTSRHSVARGAHRGHG